MSNFYSILGLNKNCSEEEIKKTYKKLALKWHPDKNKLPEANEKFKQISEAYAVLSNSEQRKIYDSQGLDGLKAQQTQQAQQAQQAAQMPTSLFDMFPGMFGAGHQGHNNQPTKGNSVQFTITISLREAYSGCVKRLKIARDVICERCHGSGLSYKSMITNTKCSLCSGQGGRIELRQIAPGMFNQQHILCVKCNGTGEYIPDSDCCQTCQAKKVIKQDNILEINIEKGIKSGNNITFKEQSDQYPNRVPGDLIVMINVQPECDGFMLDGNDLIYKKTLSLRDALTGFEFVIEHLDGRKLMVKNETDILTPQSKLKIPGEGMPTISKTNGDLNVLFDVIFPTTLAPDNKRAIRLLLP